MMLSLDIQTDIQKVMINCKLDCFLTIAKYLAMSDPMPIAVGKRDREFEIDKTV